MNTAENKNRPFSIIFHPVTYLILLWVIALLTLIDNPLGWGFFYGDYFIKYLHLYVIFTISFIIGGQLNKFFLSSKQQNTKDNLLSVNSSLRLKIVISIAVFFLVAHFLHIRDIPLIGNPFSRYTSTLGGFPDYPTRMLAPLGALAFYLCFQEKNKAYFKFFFLAISLMVLYTWRQESVNIIIGILMLYSFKNTFSFKKVFRFLLIMLIGLIILVGGLGIVRFGLHGFDNVKDIMGLILSFLHGEMVVANKFGAYVANKLDGERLNGLYCLGSYMSLFILNFEEHGAELLRIKFTDAAEAQSIGAPFGYYIDFGIVGVIVFGIIIGFLAYFLYKKFQSNRGLYFKLIYIVFFLKMIFSVRSGGVPFDPVFIYICFGLYFIFFGEFKNSLLKPVLISAYIGSLFISFVFLAIRF
jgi:oligosaccharide repeat unit polymerase